MKNGNKKNGLIGLLLMVVLSVSVIFGSAPLYRSIDNIGKAKTNTENDGTSTQATLKIGQGLAAPHGTRSFAVTSVVLDGDQIVDAYIDEYQYLSAEDAVGVPNSEELAASVAEGVVLASKRVNNELYSANMTESAGATVEIAANFDAVQEYARGKTISELESLLNDNTKEEVADAVSGATLVDTDGYLSSIIEAAKAAKESAGVAFSGDLSAFRLNSMDGAAHGTKCFTVSTVFTDGNQIALSYIDEFQYLSADGAEGVPNSEGLAENIADGFVLASKRINNQSYSANMTESAESTVEIAVNYDKIQEYVNGKSISELESFVSDKTPEEVVDAVSGATLVDTSNYINALVDAAKEVTPSSAGSRNLQIGQVEYAAHGTKSFAITSVVLEGDKIVDIYIDEYQYMSAEDAVGVPNSEDLAGSVAEGMVLGSKRVNNKFYSKNMAESADATIEIAANFDALQLYARGKTISELESLLKDKTKEEVVDAVSGATLVDADGYLASIVEAANAAKASKSVAFTGDLSSFRLNRQDGAAHGTKCFTVSTVFTDGKQIALSYIDEFQYMDADGINGIPNSEGMSENIAEGFVLASKRANNESYSEMMAESGSTVQIAVNYDSIQAYVNGKTIADLEGLVEKPAEEVIDAVSGATLVDTAGYINALIDAAKQ